MLGTTSPLRDFRELVTLGLLFTTADLSEIRQPGFWDTVGFCFEGNRLSINPATE